MSGMLYIVAICHIEFVSVDHELVYMYQVVVWSPMGGGTRQYVHSILPGREGGREWLGERVHVDGIPIKVNRSQSSKVDQC